MQLPNINNDFLKEHFNSSGILREGSALSWLEKKVEDIVYSILLKIPYVGTASACMSNPLTCATNIAAGSAYSFCSLPTEAIKYIADQMAHLPDIAIGYAGKMTGQQRVSEDLYQKLIDHTAKITNISFLGTDLNWTQAIAPACAHYFVASKVTENLSSMWKSTALLVKGVLKGKWIYEAYLPSLSGKEGIGVLRASARTIKIYTPTGLLKSIAAESIFTSLWSVTAYMIYLGTKKHFMESMTIENPTGEEIFKMMMLEKFIDGLFTLTAAAAVVRPYISFSTKTLSDFSIESPSNHSKSHEEPSFPVPSAFSLDQRKFVYDQPGAITPEIQEVITRNAILAHKLEKFQNDPSLILELESNVFN